jgi:hypothetical protein
LSDFILKGLKIGQKKQQNFTFIFDEGTFEDSFSSKIGQLWTVKVSN